MMTKLYLCLSLLFITCRVAYGQQTEVNLDIPQAQKLWDEIDILGNSTFFGHPFSLGTFTSCDKAKVSDVFTVGFSFLPNYDVEKVTTKQHQVHHIRVVPKSAYRWAKATRTIEKKIVSAEGCVLACLTEKDFVCRDCDYFVGDGGKCALYDTTGPVYLDDPNLESPFYVGNNPASNHYIIYRQSENPESCSVPRSDYAHNYFALGWKAMESGWYDLSRNLMDQAISLDSGFHMAYVGKILSNENMGYGGSDDVIGNYKESLLNIANAPDFEVKLSYQEILLVNALKALQSGTNFDEGIVAMTNTFQSDSSTLKLNIIKVIEGNGNLLRYGTYQMLDQLADEEGNIFALQLLTHNLNPYKNGKSRITRSSRDAAIAAIFDFQELEVVGTWQIIADCVDIAEYYAQWIIGSSLIDSQINFLFRNINNSSASALFGEDEDNLLVHGLDVVYMSKSLQRINQYERVHFYLLQMAQFETAETRLSDAVDDEQKKMLIYRMKANAYFSTYDYIYDKYSRDIKLEDEDWKTPVTDSSNDLALASRAYYWAAAAVQRLNTKAGAVDEIITAFSSAKDAMSNENYKTLVDLYKVVVIGTRQRINLEYQQAIASAREAAEFQDKLVDADFTISNNAESREFRMLIPLGYQFQADIFRSLVIDNTEASEAVGDKLKLNDVVFAYEKAVQTPPLNTSRILRGYGESLYTRDKDNAKLIDQARPAYVDAFLALEKAWVSPQVEGEFAAQKESKVAVERYYKTPVSGCPTTFQVISEGDGKLCWGGYVIIGVAVAIVVIIAIIVGIICLRRKAKAPQKDKEKEGAFIFSGPDLSRRESFGSSSRVAMSTLNRRSPEATPYASQTLSIQRPFHDDDYTQRSNTIGAGGKSEGGFEAYSAH